MQLRTLLAALFVLSEMTGDRAGARRAFEILRSRAGRNLTDLRSRIVLAHLEAPDP
jgi:hypothetical protein